MKHVRHSLGAKKVRLIGSLISPKGLTARPRASTQFKRNYTRKPAHVRVCPAGWHGKANDASPTWGYCGAGAFTCSLCWRGFTSEKRRDRHEAVCKGVKDLLRRTKQTIQLWVRSGTSDENAFREVFKKGDYEVRKFGFRLEDARTWLDLGGHMGTFTCLALARGCDVVTFEPHGENVMLLEHNVRALPKSMGMCGDAPRTCFLHRAAVASAAYREKQADKDGTMELLAPDKETETYRHTLMRQRGDTVLCSDDLRCEKCNQRFRSYKWLSKHQLKCKAASEYSCKKCGRCFKRRKCCEKHEAICDGKTLSFDYHSSGRVPVFTLKEVLKAYPQIEGVKIDIEGAEMEMLEEMRDSDWGGVKRLVFEYSNEYDNSAIRLRAILKNLEMHFCGGALPNKPGTYEVGEHITCPNAFAMVVHASTEPFSDGYAARCYNYDKAMARTACYDPLSQRMTAAPQGQVV
mmetsp:Transcript_137071/g.273387  ORF Transcript_137071/g.273387 Transcript_137071/m.273387 type:complete len:462 (-) Transcript_137071:127-1512(-)